MNATPCVIRCALFLVAVRIAAAEPAAPVADEAAAKARGAAIGKLIPALSSNDFDTRQKASAELLDLGTAALPELKSALGNAKDPEARHRLEIAIMKLNEKQELDGLTALPSGLRYKVLKDGTGAMPKVTETVSCHYMGKLTNGKVFDSSYTRGQPASFPLQGVIKGWTEALQLMKVGSKWLLVIPPELAYGSQGAGNLIPPNSTLIFEVELLGIEK